MEGAGLRPTFVLTKNKVAAARAAEEAKKRKGAEEEALVLERFQSSLGSTSSSSWVRGGVEGHTGGAVPVASNVPAGGTYRMMFEDDAAVVDVLPKQGGRHDADGGEHERGAAARKGRELHAFLEELKQRQEGGGSGSGSGSGTSAVAAAYPGSMATPLESETTCNIAVRNLAATVTEEALNRAFSRFGPIHSIKIMWPRNEEERARGRNTGFVLFMRRPDAEAAMDAFQDASLDGMRVSLAWAKGVRLSHVPTTVFLPASQAVSTGTTRVAIPSTSPAPVPTPATHEHEPGLSASTAAERPSAQHRGRGVRSCWDCREAVFYSSVLEDFAVPVIPHGGRRVEVRPPSTRAGRAVADLWATFLLSDGPAMDSALAQWYRGEASSQRDRDARMDVEASRAGLGGGRDEHTGGTPRSAQGGGGELHTLLAWLDDPTGDVAVYVRWRVWSLAQGDGVRTWRTVPFQATVGGPWWVPPPCPAETDLADDEAEDYERLTQENEVQREHRGREKRARVERDERGKLALEDQAEWGALLGMHTPPGGGPEQLGTHGAARDVNEIDLGDAEEEGGEGGDEYGHAGGAPAPSLDGTAAGKGLSLSNLAVRAAMVFALDHADAAHTVVAILSRSLCDQSASSPLLVARLYVAADVLSASASAQVRNASAYRSELQVVLPDAFEFLGSRLRSGHGRLSREAMRERVLRVLAAWEASFLFPALFTTGLEATFLRPHDVPLDSAGEVEVVTADALLELTRRCRVSGLSVTGGPGALKARLGWVNSHVKDKMGLGAGGTSSLMEDLASLSKDLTPAPGEALVVGSDTRRHKRARVGKSTDTTEETTGQWQSAEVETDNAAALQPHVYDPAWGAAAPHAAFVSSGHTLPPHTAGGGVDVSQPGYYAYAQPVHVPHTQGGCGADAAQLAHSILAAALRRTG